MGRSWADHGQTMGDRFMQKNPENFSFFRYRFFRKIMQICDFPTRLKQSVKLFLQTPLVTYKIMRNLLEFAMVRAALHRMRLKMRNRTGTDPPRYPCGRKAGLQAPP